MWGETNINVTAGRRTGMGRGESEEERGWNGKFTIKGGISKVMIQ